MTYYTSLLHYINLIHIIINIKYILVFIIRPKPKIF